MITAPFSGLIFDMDGTLVQSEHLHRQSWIGPLAEIGITIDDEAYIRNYAGKPGMQIIQEHIGLEGTRLFRSTKRSTTRSGCWLNIKLYRRRV